jgi:hypothetical protein
MPLRAAEKAGGDKLRPYMGRKAIAHLKFEICYGEKKPCTSNDEPGRESLMRASRSDPEISATLLGTPFC